MIEFRRKFCSAWSLPTMYKNYWSRCGHRRSGKGLYCGAHARMKREGKLPVKPKGAAVESRI